MSSVAIRVQNLSRRFYLRHQARSGVRKYTALRDVMAEALTAPFRRLRRGARAAESADGPRPVEEFWALKDVSFDVARGEAVGIIGRNGAGKSTLLKVLSRIIEPTAGRLELDGNVASLLEVGTGFHPELTGRENIFLNGAILGMRRAEIRSKFDEIVAFAEVEQFLDTPVKHYSSGMYVRLAFAVAAHLEPDILIVDEVLAVGDSDFQKKCLGKMESVSQTEGRTVLFVSHNMQAIRQMCRRVILLKQGKVAFDGDPHVGISAYLGKGEGAESLDTVELTTYPRTANREGAFLRELRFLGANGQPATTLTLNDTLTVQILFDIETLAVEFNLSMAVVHAEGLRVFSEAYSDEHPLVDLKPGRYTARFHIPMRFFKMESYFLSVTLVANGRCLDDVGGILMPAIVNDRAVAHMENNRWGVLRVPVRWDILPQSPA